MLALLLTLAFRPLFATTPASLFFLAVIGSAWYGGVRAGLLATVCATAAIDYFFIPPVYSLMPQVPGDLVLTGVFAAVALTVSLLTAARRRAEAALRQANQTLEQRVQDRTAELMQANAAVQSEFTRRKSMEEALRTSEERFRLLVENVQDYAIFLLDPAGRIITWNQGAERIKGYRTEEILGQHFSCFYLLEDQAQGKPARKLQVAAAEGRLEEEDWRVRKDGERFWANVVITALRDETGVLRGFVKVTRDVTAHKLAEEAIRQLNAELEQRVAERTAQLQRSSEDLRQFARVAAHDLQEPIRQVINYTQLLSTRYHGRLDAEADEFIAYAVAGAKRLQQLILDLLAYTEIETRPPALTAVESEAVLAGALSDLRSAVAERGATITYDPLPIVWGDAVQLQLVFRNLLANSIKFHNTQPPHVHISATPQDKEWVFTVRDNGIGIAPQDRERIFMVFQRLHHQEPYPKPGIGLAMCKKIIERHGGKIWVESTPGQGATFLFTLPAPAPSPSQSTQGS
jgi:PAS domain S-box-containing protein